MALLQKVEDNLPNVPVQGWLVMMNQTDDDEDSESGCSVYPGILDIEYRNNYWQIFKIHDHDMLVKATYHLFSAYFGKFSICLLSKQVVTRVYLDNRNLLENQPMVRILSLIKSRYFLHLLKLKLDPKFPYAESIQTGCLSVIFGTMTLSTLWSVK